MKFSIMIPCYNEEATIRRCVDSCLNQSRPPEQILFVNDSSKDRTLEYLQSYGDKITVVTTPKNTGNKSSAQEYGLQFVTSDVVITSDGDTILDREFVAEMAKTFKDRKVAAAGGYVRSLKHNWLTRCRALEYTIGQNIHKLAQSELGYMFVIPGAAGAFKVKIFRKYLTFDHDTITEDLDFTYKLHRHGFKIAYNRRAIVLTQDPADLNSYINQMRRWLGGGWQNLRKHYSLAIRPRSSLELSLIYIEGLITSALLFLLPLINLRLALWANFFLLFLASFLCSIYAAIIERRPDLMLAPFGYVFLTYINAYLFWEQFIKEIVLGRKNLVWFKPERISI